jgi:hypothetical protein
MRDRNRIKLPVVQLYIHVVFVLPSFQPLSPVPSSHPFRPSSLFRDRQSSPDGPFGPRRLSSRPWRLFVWRFCRGRRNWRFFRSLMVDWRFYSLDMLPMNNTRGSKYGLGSGFGSVLMILATGTKSGRFRNQVVGIQNSCKYLEEAVG